MILDIEKNEKEINTFDKKTTLIDRILIDKEIVGRRCVLISKNKNTAYTVLKFKGDSLQLELLQTATVVFRNLTKFVNLCNNTFINTPNARSKMISFAPHGVHHPMNAVSSDYLIFIQ